MELASITPKLGAYFGASDGVLVVQAPENAAFKLEDGDVIQTIDGRKPEDGAHALRILRSYKSGEKLTSSVLRQRKPLTLAVVMPDRPDFDEHFMASPPCPPMPPMPPMPADAAVAGHAGGRSQHASRQALHSAPCAAPTSTTSFPKSLIAQQPLAERSASRLLTLDGASGAIEDRHFPDLPQLLRAGRSARLQRHARDAGASVRPQGHRRARRAAARAAARGALALVHARASKPLRPRCSCRAAAGRSASWSGVPT